MFCVWAVGTRAEKKKGKGKGKGACYSRDCRILRAILASPPLSSLSPFCLFVQDSRGMRRGIQEWKGLIASTQAPDDQSEFLTQALSDVLVECLDLYDSCGNNINMDEERSFLLWLLEKGAKLTSDDFSGYVMCDNNENTALTRAVLAKFPDLHRGPAAWAAAKRGLTSVIVVLFGDGKAEEYRAKSDAFLSNAANAASAESEQVDKQQLTDALVELCEYASTCYIELLVQAGADVNGYSPDPEKNPLFACIKGGNFEFVARMLLENGANPNIENSAILEFALEKKNDDLVLLLLKFGARMEKTRPDLECYLQEMEGRHKKGEDCLL